MKSYGDRQLVITPESSIINGLNMLQASPINLSSPIMPFSRSSRQPTLRESIYEQLEEQGMASPTFARQSPTKTQNCQRKKYVCTEVQIAFDGDQHFLQRLQARLRDRDIHILRQYH